MIRSLNPDTVFTAEQVSLRNSIGERLSAGLRTPMATQLLIASFLYSPPGLLQIANAEVQLPEWLFPDYFAIYQQKSGAVQNQSQDQPATELPQPDLGSFLPHSKNHCNRIQLNRLLGLSNLYYIDLKIKKSSKSFVKFVCLN